MDGLPEIERSTDVDASPEEVWERIVDGALAEEWLGVEIDPRPGGPVSVPDEDVIGTVEEVEPGRSITWSWRHLRRRPVAGDDHRRAQRGRVPGHRDRASPRIPDHGVPS